MSLFSACDKFDDTAIWDEIKALKERVTVLEEKVAENVSALQSMVSVGSIASWDFNSETGKGVITLVDGKKVTINQSISGYSLITVTKGADGVWYWAICRDGVSTPLEINGKKVPVSITPALKISEDQTWMISIDGGMTWVDTGIDYVSAPTVTPGDSDSSDNNDSTGDTGSSDDQDQITDPEVVFFKKAEKDGDYLIITLADDSVIKVAIVGESIFAATAEAMWFSRVSMEKAVMLEMVNVSAYTITEKPEGWKVRIEEDQMYVTSPVNFVDFPKSGTVKVLALFENGLPSILSVDVAYEPMFSLSYVNGKVKVTLSENTGEDFNAYVMGGCQKAEYVDENSIVTLLNDAAAELTPLQGTKEYELSELVEDYDPSKAYVIYAAPYLPANMVADAGLKYEVSDVQTIVCNPATGWKFTDVRFDSATLTAVLEYDKYYGGFFKMTDWTNYGKDNILESVNYGQLVACEVASYNGPANGFPDGVVDEHIVPDTEYVVWCLPVNEEGKYTAADFILHSFTTPNVKADANIAAPAVNVKEVTISGFTADVTPASGAYKTYAAIVKTSVIPATDEETVKYLIDKNIYSETDKVNTVSSSSFSSEDEICLIAVSVSKDGGYGAVVKEDVELKKLTFTDAMGVDVTGVEYGLGSVDLTLSFTGNPKSVTCFMATSGSVFYGDEILQKLMALGQYGNAVTKEITSNTMTVTFTELDLGVEYFFYAVVNGEDGTASKLYKSEAIVPQSGIDYIKKNSEDYMYGIPVFTGTCEGTSKSYTLTLDVDMPSNCKKYWLFKGDSEYFTGDVYTDSDKLVTEQFLLLGETVHAESIKGQVYDMNKESRIYMVWLDDQDRYHAIYEYNPKAK